MRQTDARFWAKVDRSGGPESCWPWMGSRYPKGYGRVYVDGRRETAHRVALSLSLDRPLTPGEKGIHDCDNPPCCNTGPGHVKLGTQAQNIADMVARGRGLVGVLNGMHRHPERSGKTRLTEREVLAIRALKGSATQAKIAVRFGISRASVSDIVRRRRWGHIDALAT